LPSDDVVIVTEAQVAIVMLYAWLPVQPYSSVAVMVNDALPALPLYVPVIAPLLELNDNPVGNAPLVTA
jgi:hypothetical protein